MQIEFRPKPGQKYIDKKELCNFLSEPHINLVLNMSAGLLPENLSKEETEILRNQFGENWFEELGYYEPNYKRSAFDEFGK